MRLDVRIVLESRPQAAAEARDQVRFELRDRVAAPMLHDLLVVVTELVTNSVRHGPGTPIQLRIALNEDGSIRGEVEDQGDGEVAIREMREDFEDGLGLRIVDTLTDRWAVYEGSTHVWFEMRPPAL
jgi:anti-sigma regulatory factor (Ser/Thr protein kinase)